MTDNLPPTDAAQSEFDTSRNVSDEEIEQWAATRADDAGFLARRLMAVKRRDIGITISDTPSPQPISVGSNPYHREPSAGDKEAALQAAADANGGYIDGKTKRIVLAALEAFTSTPGVAALNWSRNGWVEAFAEPEGLGVWYSISPKTPVRGAGDPPFQCFVIRGTPSSVSSARESLGADFQSVDLAKAAAQADFDRRVKSVISPPPVSRGIGDAE